MRVGIVGGGITGLALTHALARVGIDSLLFEKSERPGGVIESRTIDGRIFEMGPQRTRLVPTVRRLVDELGLTDRLVPALAGARLFVWSRGRLRAVPMRPASLLGSDLLRPGGRLRLCGEPLTRGLQPDESVADYFTRKAGGEAYRTLFGPLVSATFASDPAVMPARHSLPMILEPLGVRRSLLAAARRWKPKGAVACSFETGMEELPAALAARHAGRIRSGVAITAVEPSSGGPGLRVESGELEVFDAVVLTVPAPVASDLLSGTASEGVSRSLGKLGHNEVAVVSLRANQTHSGFGFQTAFDSPWRTRGVTWAGSLFGREGVCTAYLGGGLDREITGWSDSDVASCAAREFEKIHGTPAEPVAVSRAWLPRYDASWDGLDRVAVPAGVTIAANYMGRLGISARIAQAEALAETWSADRPSSG